MARIKTRTLQKFMTLPFEIVQLYCDDRTDNDFKWSLKYVWPVLFVFVLDVAELIPKADSVN